jgi:hypothetical protein
MSCSKPKEAPWTRFGLGAGPCLSHRGSSGRLRGAATRPRILDAIERLQTKAPGRGRKCAKSGDVRRLSGANDLPA